MTMFLFLYWKITEFSVSIFFLALLYSGKKGKDSYTDAVPSIDGLH